ncbi:MAG: prepilin-type N-terminal cleavage/methylation domain-containing protein [Phycisphaerales bacterium]
MMNNTRATTCTGRRESPGKSGGARRGFTLIEVLVVVGVIIILITLVIVGLALASGKAGAARTQALMGSISQGMAQFKSDHGMIPPTLGDRNPSMPDDLRNLFAPPAASDYAALQDWWSITTPAEYLLGYGGAAYDGANGLGIRSPGHDGYWGGARDTSGNGTPGEVADRRPEGFRPGPDDRPEGRVYGPYIEINDERFVGSIDFNTGNVFLPNEAGYDSDAPKAIVDYWGEPIRFYAKHPGRVKYPDRVMSLADVVLLRPYNMAPGSSAASLYADAAGDTSTSIALKSAEFALFSPGEDRTGNQNFRIDDPNFAPTAFTNEDNIVVTGQ